MSRSVNPYSVFLSQLRAARMARNMTQSQLARRIKLSRTQYTAIENGRSVLNYAHLHNISAALGVRFVIGDLTFPLASRFVSA